MGETNESCVHRKREDEEKKVLLKRLGTIE